MPTARFSIARADPEMRELIAKTDQKTLAVWAIDCAERVMRYFEEARPDDPRPRRALAILQEWIDTGEFSMPVIREASLESHAAAREVGEDNAARSAARAAGQAVATAHVPTHAYGPAIYGQQAMFRETGSLEAAEKERGWQLARLVELRREEDSTASS